MAMIFFLHKINIHGKKKKDEAANQSLVRSFFKSREKKFLSVSAANEKEEKKKFAETFLWLFKPRHFDCILLRPADQFGNSEVASDMLQLLPLPPSRSSIKLTSCCFYVPKQRS